MSKGEMPFLDHLEELRRRILVSLAAAVIGVIAGIVLVVKADVIGILMRPLNQAIAQLAASGYELPEGMLSASGRLHFLSLTEPLWFVMKMGLGIGLLLVSPVIVYQVWAFLSPALTLRERRVIIPSLYLGLLLFLAGVALAYFVALPASIRFLLLFGAEWFTPSLTAGYYLSFVVSVMLSFGILFEMPVVIMIMAALGLVTTAFLRARRRQAWVALTVMACVVTPGDLIITTAMLLVPLFVLYEVSIALASLVSRKERAEPDATIADIAAVSALIGWRLRQANTAGR
jgi:sec-independent protein translocase protein TatC